MFQHLFKLIWKRKGKNGLLVLEIFLAFIILFAVVSVLLRGIDNYRAPFGHDYERIWTIQLNYYMQDSSEIASMKPRLYAEVLDMPEIDAASYSSSVSPFGYSMSTSVSTIDGHEVTMHLIDVDEHYAQTYGIDLAEGRWFEAGDETATYPPALINEYWRDTYPSDVFSIDSILPLRPEVKIKGIIKNFRYQQQFDPETPMLFSYKPSVHSDLSMLNLRVNGSADAAFEARLIDLVRDVTKLDDILIVKLDERRRMENRSVIVPAVATLLVCGFLIINVALGLFGLLYNSIRKRRGEIGLRRAVGAYRSSIARQFILEIWLLAGIAMLAAALLCVQVPLMNFFDLADRYFYWSIVITFVFISLLVLLCALYPGVQAARVHPAVALRED